MYELKIINDKKTWNEFIVNSDIEFYSFLSSWEWGEFKKMSWFWILRYWIFDWKDLIWVLPLIKVKAKRWSYLFAAHSPLIKDDVKKSFKMLKKKCKICNCEISVKEYDDKEVVKTENWWIKCSWCEINLYFEVLKEILPELKKITKSEKCDFIRFNSSIQNTLKNQKNYRRLGFIDAPMHEHAEDTHLLDLEKTEEELLANMKKKERILL